MEQGPAFLGNEKGRCTTTVPFAPAKGHSRTAHGQRPLRDAAQDVLLLLIKGRGPGWRFEEEQLLDAHASFKMSCGPCRTALACYLLKEFTLDGPVDSGAPL